MSDLRVLYSFPHPLGSPGIGSIALAQIEGVVAAGGRVDVWTTSVARPAPSGVSVRTTMSAGRFRLPHRAVGVERAWAYHDARVASALRRGSTEAGNRWDIVHTWPLAAKATLRAAARHGVLGFREVPNRHTADAYASAAAAYEQAGVEAPVRSSHRYDRRRLRRELDEYDAADLLLVPADHVADTFLERGVPEARLARHAYGYDPLRFFPLAREEADEGVRPPGAVRLAFVGRGEPRKGLHLALQAWVGSVASERGRFVICGNIEADYRASLQPLLDHRSVDVQPFTPDVRALLARSDALVLPSYDEGSALVTYEAQACGATLLVSDRTGARCTPGTTALVHPVGDVKALRRDMDRLATDRDELDRLRAASLANAASISWADAGRRLYSLYEDASNARRS